MESMMELNLSEMENVNGGALNLLPRLSKDKMRKIIRNAKRDVVILDEFLEPRKSEKAGDRKPFIKFAWDIIEA